MEVNLTPVQTKVLLFIQDYIKQNKYGPTYKEINQYMKWSAESVSHEVVDRLKKKGYIEKQYYQSRSFKILKEI